MDSNLLKLEIYATVEGGRWLVFDRNMVLIASLNKLLVEKAIEGDIANAIDFAMHEDGWLMWSRWNANRSNRRLCEGDEWTSKIESWLSSINKRHVSIERKIKEYKTDCWRHAINRMILSSQSKENRRSKVLSDEWYLWCESKGSNYVKRSKRKKNSSGITAP